MEIRTSSRRIGSRNSAVKSLGVSVRKANIISTSWFPDSYILALWGHKIVSISCFCFVHVSIRDDGLPIRSGCLSGTYDGPCQCPIRPAASRGCNIQ